MKTLKFLASVISFVAVAQSCEMEKTILEEDTKNKQHKTTENNLNINLNIIKVTIGDKEQVIQDNTIDFGKIPYSKEKARAILTILNAERSPLILADIKTSCGCTVPVFSKDPILPDQTREITLEYDATLIGAFTKTLIVTMRTADWATQDHTITIKGEVLPE
jgi:hypothetical protein